MRQDAIEEIQNALWELSQQEQEDNGQEHARCPVRLPLASIVFLISGFQRFHHEIPSLGLGFLHGSDQQTTQNCQPDARDQFDDDGLYPKVEVIHKFICSSIKFEGDHPDEDASGILVLYALYGYCDEVGYTDDQCNHIDDEYRNLGPLKAAQHLKIK